MKYSDNGRFLEIYFDTIPDEKLREALKVCGWRYNSKKQCWQNFVNYENRQFINALLKEEADNGNCDWYEELDRYCFESDNQIIIRTNSFYCNIHHKLEDIAGEVAVIDKAGNVRFYIVPMAYCESCSLYYMLKETYSELKAKGIIRCQIMTFEQYSKVGFYDGDFEKWRDRGPLKLWGYCVDSKNDLSDSQRHAILEDIVDCGAMTKDAVLSYLDFFIRLNGGKDAIYVGKWKDDRKYLANYKIGSARRVRFS